MSVFDRIWKKYDVNEDNKMDLAEFGKMCYDLGHFMSAAQLKAAFSLIDSDGSGTIGKEEFRKFWREDDRFEKVKLDEAQLHKLVELGDYFRYYDGDKNGSLDKAEFAKMCAHLTKNGYNLKLMNFSFEAIDKDGSGQIAFNEYVAFMVDQGALDKMDGTRPIHG